MVEDVLIPFTLEGKEKGKEKVKYEISVITAHVIRK